MLRDIDTLVSGINDYLAANSSGTEPWTRNDVYAVNALKGQFLGRDGGDGARRSSCSPRSSSGSAPSAADSVFDDLRQFRSPDHHAAIDGRFDYGRIPDRAPGSVVIDPGSFEEYLAEWHADT